jgi:hypothetical protein
MKETRDLLGRQLFCHVLITSYSFSNGQFCGQTDGVVICSSLSPVIANLYVGDYEKEALESPPPPKTPLLVSLRR